jgi:hypothetical protein
VAKEENALVTGAAVGVVFALLIALASRLTMVTEQRTILDDEAADVSDVPQRDSRPARELALSEELDIALVDITGEAQQRRRARAN